MSAISVVELEGSRLVVNRDNLSVIVGKVEDAGVDHISVVSVAVPGLQGFKRRSIVRPSLNPKPGGEAGKAGEATPRSSRGRRMREAAMEELGRTVARPRIR